MRFLFIMDPFQNLAWDKDTSFAFMRGAARRGHEIWHCLPQDVANVGRQVYARASQLRVLDGAAEPGGPLLRVERVEPELELAQLDCVWIRKDPPFDRNYLFLTHQLDLIVDRVLVMNSPRGVRDANEKMFAFQFVDHMPRSLVTADPRRILSFVAAVGGKAVLKPLDGAGGSGVVVLSSEDQNARSLADIWTLEGKQLAMVQEYQPAVRVGDKRVILLDGKCLGAILRVPRPDDVRANIHAGGRVEPTSLTETEARLVADVGPTLREHGLWFVGLDLIGERLIEVNVTSPTGVQELGRFNGRPAEDDVVAWVEERAAAWKLARPAGVG